MRIAALDPRGVTNLMSFYGTLESSRYQTFPLEVRFCMIIRYTPSLPNGDWQIWLAGWLQMIRAVSQLDLDIIAKQTTPHSMMVAKDMRYDL